VGWSTPSATNTPPQAACPTWHTTSLVRGNQIKCLERRLQPYFKTSRDPILVSLFNCEGVDDQPRLDPPGRILPTRPKKPSATAPEKQAYLLSRSDAECLAKALAARPRKLKEFRLELQAC